MVRDLRGKELSEGDVVLFTPEVKLTDAIVVGISAPMVQQDPNGQQVMCQRVSLVFQVNFFAAAQGGVVPVGVSDKADTEAAKKALELLTQIVQKMHSGSGGGNVVLMEN